MTNSSSGEFGGDCPKQRASRKCVNDIGKQLFMLYLMMMIRVLTKRLTNHCSTLYDTVLAILSALSSALISPDLGNRQFRQMIRSRDNDHYSQICSVPLDTRKEDASHVVARGTHS